MRIRDGKIRIWDSGWKKFGSGIRETSRIRNTVILFLCESDFFAILSVSCENELVIRYSKFYTFSWDCLFAMQKLAHVLFLHFFIVYLSFLVMKRPGSNALWSEKLDVHFIDYDENTWFSDTYEELFSVNIWWGEELPWSVRRTHLALRVRNKFQIGGQTATLFHGHNHNQPMYYVPLLTYMVQFLF